MTKYTGIMLDIETLGNAPGCVIFAIGAVPFNLATGDVGTPLESFYRVISVESARSWGLVSNVETLKWWSEQSAAARAEYDAAHAKGSFGLSQTLDDFSTFVKSFGENATVWGKGPSFDCAILKAAYDLTHRPLPWKFWNERCVRTIYDGSIFPVPDNYTWYQPEVAHNALHDARAQAENVCAIYRLNLGGDKLWAAFDSESGAFLGTSWCRDADEVETPSSGNVFWRSYKPSGTF